VKVLEVIEDLLQDGGKGQHGDDALAIRTEDPESVNAMLDDEAHGINKAAKRNISH